MSNIDKVTVLNFNENYVFMPVDSATDKTYKFSPSIDGVPSQVTMPFTEVEYANGQSDVFRTGMLLFKHADPEIIYKALNIDDFENILTNQKIEDILLSPTIEGLQRIIDVREHSTFDRIRAVFVSLKNSNSFDLSNRVIKIIEARSDEMRKNQYRTEILLQSKDASNNNIVESENMIALKEQNELMKKQLDDMQKMMSEFMANQGKPDNKEVEPDEDSEKKKVGRPSTKKTEE